MDTSSIVVSKEIQRGLSALDDKHGHAEIIAQDDERSYVFVDLGEIDLNGYGYDQDSARVILRIHEDFPGGRHYGMVTVPVLTVDGQRPDSTTVNHQQADCLNMAGIEDDYLYWSRDWQEFPVTEAGDMAKATAFFRGTLRNPFDK